MKIKINRIYHNDTDQAGSPLVTKAGKPYVRCMIYSTGTDGEEKKISGFGSENTKMWMANDEVDVEITESNGYLNFKESGDSILQRLKRLEEHCFGGQATQRPETPSNTVTGQSMASQGVSTSVPPPKELTVDDIPF